MIRYEPYCDCLGGHVSMVPDPNGRWCRADDPSAVADDPSGIVQQMPEGGDEALKPCPWCQSKFRLSATQVCAGGGWGIICKSCHVYHDARADSPAAAIAAWNRRATEADLRAEVERLTRQLGQANAVGRAKGWEEAAAFLDGAKGVNDDGSEYDLSPSEFAAFALSGVRSFADAIAVLSPETDGGQDG